MVEKIKFKQIVLIGLALFVLAFSSDNKSRNNTSNATITDLQTVIDEMRVLGELGDSAAGSDMYRNYLLPKERTISEAEYVDGFIKYHQDNPYIQSVQHSIRVDGDVGYVDRTSMSCDDPKCDQVNSSTRAFKEYIYQDGRWYYTPRNVLCPRSTGYEMEPEFERALSLLKQRYFANYPDEEVKQLFEEVLNCVDVQYADNDSDLAGAEGIFSFSPGQSIEKLSIYVSPNYKDTDDLLMAVLLSHETTHAVNYIIGQIDGKAVDCMRDEASAFQMQSEFVSRLNEEEKRSLLSRAMYGGSNELNGLLNSIATIPYLPGNTFSDKSLYYVENSEFYQRQCANQ